MTRLAWGAATHVGHKRAINEDSFVATAPVFAVADGMGGHDSGEVASGLVAERLSQLAESDDLLPEVVVDALRSVHGEIQSRHDGASDREMGTTVAGIVLLESSTPLRWLMINVGDSRVYRLHGDDFDQVSVDHSVVQELITAGVITSESAQRHPDRHVITRALGVGDELVADFALFEPIPGERFLLCSDGVHGQLRADEIVSILREHIGPQGAADALIAAVLAGRAPDNLTAIVVDVLDGSASDDVAGDTSPRHLLDIGATDGGHDDQDDADDQPATDAEPDGDAGISPRPVDAEDGGLSEDDDDIDRDGGDDGDSSAFIRVPKW